MYGVLEIWIVVMSVAEKLKSFGGAFHKNVFLCSVYEQKVGWRLSHSELVSNELETYPEICSFVLGMFLES